MTCTGRYLPVVTRCAHVPAGAIKGNARRNVLYVADVSGAVTVVSALNDACMYGFVQLLSPLRAAAKFSSSYVHKSCGVSHKESYMT